MRMRKLLPWLAAACALALAGAATGWAYMRFYEPDRRAYPVRGIDVSHHQGPIDWPKVAADDVSFVFMKASEGGDHRDGRFAENWREVRRAGVPAGAYHFFTLCRPGADQAANFLGALGSEHGELPPALDLEFGGNCATPPPPDAVLREIEVFLDLVERQVGRQVVLYVTAEFWEAFGERLPKRPLWVRSLFWGPRQQDWTFWQYHNGSRVRGIAGPVDLNVFRGSREELRKVGKGPAPRS